MRQRCNSYLYVSLVLNTLSTTSIHAEVACPDDKARELFRVATDWSSNVETAGRVIKEATRPMDGPGLRIACFRFAYHQYWGPRGHTEEIMDRSKFSASIPGLTVRFPLLARCPEKFIDPNPWYPVIRYRVEPSKEILARELTGWVEFQLTVNERGMVESATVVASSDGELEEVSTHAVLKFEYLPRLNDELEPVRTSGVGALVQTDYHDLARASGCERY